MFQKKEIPYSSTQKVNKKKNEIFLDDRVKSFTNNNMEGTILYVHNVSPEFLLVFCP